ncbi:MAG: hypothetical protein ACLS9F_10545 [Clostridium paraputrificum]
MISSDLIIFSHLLIYLVDSGKKETLEVIEDKQKEIVKYIIDKYNDGQPMYRNVNVQDVQRIVSEQWISVSKSKEMGIDNNGLLYLLSIIIDIMGDKLFTYESNEG